MIQNALLKTGNKWGFPNQFLWIALFSSAILPLFLGKLSPFALIVLTPIYFAVHAYFQRSLKVKIDLIGWVFIAILIIQIALAIITAKAPSDILFGLNFLPLLLYVFALPVLQNARVNNPIMLFANFSLVGALLAMCMALYAVYGLNISRGGYGLVNANDLSGLALLFGFLALVGMVGKDVRTKDMCIHAYLLVGPIAGLATILITGSRGALLAYGAMLFVTALFLLPKKMRLPGMLAIVAIIALAFLALIFIVQDSRVTALPEIIQSFLSGNAVTDKTANIRLVLYMGGIEAFLQAPVFGHGWANFVDVAATYFVEVSVRDEVVGIPQLHNDLINFAAASGIIGVLTYVACLAVPLIAVFRAPEDTYLKAKKLGVLLLVTCYAVRGLTDLMIGFEYGTSFFVIVLALLMSISAPKSKADT